MKKSVYVVDLKMINYQKAYNIQMIIHKLCHARQMRDTILFLETKPTITIGRSGSISDLLMDENDYVKQNIEVVPIDRGGDITYHGPGQLVVSFIAHVKEHTNNIHHFLRLLEEVIIVCLKKYNISASRKEQLSGVWVNDKKIASIGISVEHGVTRHGFALNINNDLSFFDLIIPCGLVGVTMTSIKECTNQAINKSQVKQDIVQCFKEVFDVDIEVMKYTKGMFEHEN